jgi:plastocyanin
MNRKIIFLVLVLLIFYSFPAAGEVYVVYTDREFGFWGVRSYDINHTLNYTSRTLNINTGDSIEWVNMDIEGDRITIISDNTLWEGGKALGSTGNKFRFTFNSSGDYRFHIVENTRVRLNSSNNTNSLNNETTTVTYEDDAGELHTITINKDTGEQKTDTTSNPMNTDQFNYQRQIIRVTGPTIGNGTYPIRIARPIQAPSQITAVNRPAVQATARPTSTPSKSLTQAVAAAAVPKPLESYQEFTIYEILKRWVDIIMGSL